MKSQIASIKIEKIAPAEILCKKPTVMKVREKKRTPVFAIDIPMLGRANSLNVATAYSIALFELLRQGRAATNVKMSFP